MSETKFFKLLQTYPGLPVKYQSGDILRLIKNSYLGEEMVMFLVKIDSFTEDGAIPFTYIKNYPQFFEEVTEKVLEKLKEI